MRQRNQPGAHAIVDIVVVVRDHIGEIGELGRTLGYTLAHYNQAMNRLVSHFKPTLSPLIKGMDANNTARFLMSLNTPKPERQRHFQAIKNMTRPVGMELRAIMGILNQRATGYYATEPEEARANLIDNMMLVGLQNFTAGITSAAIRNTIQQQQLDNIRPDWIRILETAIASEELQPNIRSVFVYLKHCKSGFT